jgi:uncharacterized protein YihD (DUF1040 family)
MTLEQYIMPIRRRSRSRTLHWHKVSENTAGLKIRKKESCINCTLTHLKDEIIIYKLEESDMIKGTLVNYLVHTHVYKDESIDLCLAITKTQLVVTMMTLLTIHRWNWVDPLIKCNQIHYSKTNFSVWLFKFSKFKEYTFHLLI